MNLTPVGKDAISRDLMIHDGRSWRSTVPDAGAREALQSVAAYVADALAPEQNVYRGHNGPVASSDPDYRGST